VSAAQAVAIALVVVPALAFVLWPLVTGRGEGNAARGIAPGDAALELGEEKTSVYRALRELAFDHEAGHLSDDDYEALRARYEGRAAEILGALDALGPASPPPKPAPVAPARPAGRGLLRHPAALVGGALVLVVFGMVIGLNAGRFTEPDQTVIPPGSRIPVPAIPEPGRTMPPVAGIEPGKPIPPEMLAGMLRAARASLAAQRYSEAIAAYQAVLKRDPRNVDALTHLGVIIVATGNHADTALETFDKALAIDPSYAPAHLYRGHVLYEVKRDYPGAVKAWERFLALVPAGEDHQRVAALVKDARDKSASR
jgi:tetratricopeptide (TPR) repeat protein